MVRPSYTLGIIIRWDDPGRAISLVVLVKPGIWAPVIAIALNALGTYFIVDYIQRYKV